MSEANTNTLVTTILEQVDDQNLTIAEATLIFDTVGVICLSNTANQGLQDEYQYFRGQFNAINAITTLDEFQEYVISNFVNERRTSSFLFTYPALQLVVFATQVKCSSLVNVEEVFSRYMEYLCQINNQFRELHRAQPVTSNILHPRSVNNIIFAQYLRDIGVRSNTNAQQ